MFIVACNDDDDATNSLDNRTSLVLTPSDYEIELKEDTPDEVALTLNWTEADPIGSDYYISYLYKMDLENNSFGTNTMIREYIDDDFLKVILIKNCRVYWCQSGSSSLVI